MIVVNDPVAGQRISNAVSKIYHPAEDVVIAHYRKDGTLLGGVVFENYTGATMTIHQAAWDKRWVSKSVIWSVFAYAFLQAKCLSLIGPVKETERATLDITRRLGFQPVYTLPHYFADGAGLIITRMWAHECKWLDGNRTSLQCDVSVMPRPRVGASTNG